MNITVTNNWPSGLPLPYVDVSGAPQHPILASTLASAHPTRRLRFSGTPVAISARWVLSVGEMEDFLDFYQTDLRNGISTFSIELRYPKQTELSSWVARFGSAITTTWEDGRWDVSTTLILERLLAINDVAEPMPGADLTSTTPRLSWLPDALKDGESDGLLVATNLPAATTTGLSVYFTWDPVQQAYELLDHIHAYPVKCTLLAWWQVGSESEERWMLRVQPDTELDDTRLQTLFEESDNWYGVVGRRDYKSVGTPKSEHREMALWGLRAGDGVLNEVSDGIYDIEIASGAFDTELLAQETLSLDGVYPTAHLYFGRQDDFFIYPTSSIEFERSGGNDSNDADEKRYIKALTSNWTGEESLEDVTATTYDRNDTTMTAAGTYSREWGARVRTAAEIIDVELGNILLGAAPSSDYDLIEDLDTILGKIVVGTATADEVYLAEHIDAVLGNMSATGQLYYNE